MRMETRAAARKRPFAEEQTPRTPRLNCRPMPTFEELCPDVAPVAGGRKLSEKRVHQLLVLMRAAAHQQGVKALLREARQPDVMGALQTQFKNAEGFLAAGAFTEQQLWQAITPLVDGLKAALDANSGEDYWIDLRDMVCDGYSSEGEEVEEEEIKWMQVLYAAKSPQAFGGQLLLAWVKQIQAACTCTLAPQAANASNPPDAHPAPPGAAM